MAEWREQHAAVLVSPRPGRGAVYEEGRHRMPPLRVEHPAPGTPRAGSRHAARGLAGSHPRSAGTGPGPNRGTDRRATVVVVGYAPGAQERSARSCCQSRSRAPRSMRIGPDASRRISPPSTGGRQRRTGRTFSSPAWSLRGWEPRSSSARSLVGLPAAGWSRSLSGRRCSPSASWSRSSGRSAGRRRRPRPWARDGWRPSKGQSVGTAGTGGGILGGVGAATSAPP